MDKKDISIFKLSEAFVKISSNPTIAKEIKRATRARVPNYRFMPKFKQGTWDGYAYFFKDGMLPIGLVPYVKEFAKNGNYSVYVDFDDTNEMEYDEFKDFIQCLHIPFKPRDYQFLAAFEAIQKSKLNILIPTAGGKSLIQYLIASFMRCNDMKTLVIVPTLGLVDQLFGDFMEYGLTDPYGNVHTIHSGKEKTLKSPITISTWQSLQYQPPSFFDSVDCLMIDESHGAKSTSLQNISKNSCKAKWRIGLSGTYPSDKTTDWFAIVGAMGDIKRYADYKKLREDKVVAHLLIKDVFLMHSENICEDNFIKNRKTFSDEISYINRMDNRNEMIAKTAGKVKGNTIILFTKRDHGRALEAILKATTSKQIMYIDGTISPEYRDNVRSFMEDNDDVVTVASYGTFSTGVNIKNVHNIILASNYKSKTKVIQSIGRGLRTNEFKDSVTIYDFIDYLKHDYKDLNKVGKEIVRTYTNFSIKHYKDRLDFYEAEGYTNREVIRVKL